MGIELFQCLILIVDLLDLVVDLLGLLNDLVSGLAIAESLGPPVKSYVGVVLHPDRAVGVRGQRLEDERKKEEKDRRDLGETFH
jgi:hypothetical protein